MADCLIQQDQLVDVARQGKIDLFRCHGRLGEMARSIHKCGKTGWLIWQGPFINVAGLAG